MTQAPTDPTIARDTCVEFLDLQRAKVAEHRARGEQLNFATDLFITLARDYGLPWDDIGHALGTTGNAARKAHMRRRT